MNNGKEVSMANTKKEILDAYNTLLEKHKAKQQVELKPEKVVEQRKAKEIVEVADSLSSEGIIKAIETVKMENGKILNKLSDNLENLTLRYNKIKDAIEIKNKELKEIYEIEKSAFSLAALIEAQHKKREDFECEMEARKKAMEDEIASARTLWEKEKKAYTEKVKEIEAEEKKKREREKEEYTYCFEREKELAKNKFEDEIARLEKEMTLKKEEMETSLSEREKDIKIREKNMLEKEKELADLKLKVESFPKQLEDATNKAVKETAVRINTEAKSRETLFKKEAEGEKMVMTSKIDALEKTVKEQNLLIEKLSAQTEKSYQKVQDIAIKAIEGSNSAKTLTNLEQMIIEKTKRQPASTQDH